jgi:Na+-translocating ferredoxin:NAD+ oxidoreductase RnfD subunit
MSVKTLVWLRNIMLVLLLAQIGYFLFVKYYKGMPVEWNSFSFIITAAAFSLLVLAIRKQAAKQ